MLTERQAEILTFVQDFQERHGAPPSTREVARQFGISQPTALGHFRALMKKQKLEKLADGRFVIGIRSRGPQVEIPLFGSIPAGNPLANEQQPGETVVVDPRLFRLRAADRRALWALRVNGDSMDGVGIHDGDVVIMLRREPRANEIIAALVDGTSTTLKRAVREHGRWILRSANRRYRDIVPSTLEVQGVLIGLMRTGPINTAA